MLPLLLLFAFFGVVFAGHPISTNMRWPRDQYTAMFTIYWCFENQIAETQITVQRVDLAWATWTSVLGTASEGSKHALEFKRWKPPGAQSYPYCYDTNNKWTYGMPRAAVRIRYDPATFGASALPGYQGNVKGAHYLTQGPPGLPGSIFVDPAWQIAHELGHVFGLLHEHQRPDRDIYVQYRPERVNGFSQAWQSAQAAGVSFQQLTEEDGCAELFNWDLGKDFRKLASAPDYQSVYDYASIMHYDGITGMAVYDDRVPYTATDPNSYPMAQLGLADAQNQIPLILLPLQGRRPGEAHHISAGDAAAIRFMYPHY